MPDSDSSPEMKKDFPLIVTKGKKAFVDFLHIYAVFRSNSQKMRESRTEVSLTPLAEWPEYRSVTLNAGVLWDFIQDLEPYLAFEERTDTNIEIMVAGPDVPFRVRIFDSNEKEVSGGIIAPTKPIGMEMQVWKARKIPSLFRVEVK